jgi:hypothetical protein
MQQISRDKTDRLQRATAEFTTSALDGYGLRCQLPARPAPYASYPVFVHRLASLLHASFRPHLTMTPLRFAITSPPSGCEGDLHPQAVNHARRTTQISAPEARRLLAPRFSVGNMRTNYAPESRRDGARRMLSLELLRTFGRLPEMSKPRELPLRIFNGHSSRALTQNMVCSKFFRSL